MFNDALTLGKLTSSELIRDYKLADYAVECLINIVDEFEQNIQDNQQAAIKYIQYGNQPILIESFGYYNPHLVIIYGTTSDGNEARVVQHISQVNLCLIAVERVHPEKPRRKIGFLPSNSEDE